ncbi:MULTISPECIES: PepSY domain-containing protein [Lichenihabitans]|uniref:PepSY domain-containing protein n=1 Tax=Lichenihabitans TaxID=2723776 RepID=UPI0010362605|nr:MULTISPECIES: PepSY domain-containing protein [Lichenihabitans]UDL93667.1 PepSY domain-containing protein [Lichenihabitans sp. PAMC28606]
MKFATFVLVSSLFATAASAQTATTTTAPQDGNSNQAVATTGANAMQPAKGANSFTEGQAQGRIEKEGFTKVTALKKDNDGVWRGQGMKGSASVGVWLDYKGNVGQQ